MTALAELLEHLLTYWPEIGGAVASGLVLGLERESKDKPAGLRTILLISLGSALYMIVSELVPQLASGPIEIIQPDPTRVASQVVVGIGFLGAGTIIHGQGTVHGLTTAAVIWVAAAIGLVSGLGLPLLAISLSVLTVLLLVVMDPVRRALARRAKTDEIDILVPDDGLAVRLLEQILLEHQGERGLEIVDRHDENLLRVRLRYQVAGASPTRLLEALRCVEGVRGLPLRLPATDGGR